MSTSVTTAPTQILETPKSSYAYRRFGPKTGTPLLFLQHFIGNLDNWDPSVTEPLAAGHDVILFDNAGVGRSGGTVPTTMSGMAAHAFAFLDGLGIKTCDVLGFSLGGMVAQQMALERPRATRKLILAGTAPRGGEDIMHLDKPAIGQHLQNPNLKGYEVLQKIFFAPTATSQAAGKDFIDRLLLRQADRDSQAGPDVASAQLAAFRDWEHYDGDRFADLKLIPHPTLVVNGVLDEMVPIVNSYFLAENLPNAVLLTYPNAGHGAIFQWHDSFTNQVTAFLASKTEDAPY